MIGRSRRNATEVIGAYQALEARLEPFAGEFHKPVARIGESPAERQQRDADVAETVDELTGLTKKRTAKLLIAATRAARRHRRRAAEDEAGLAEALDSLAERYGPVDKVAPTAEAALELALRVVLARWVIGSSRPQPADTAAAVDEVVYCETPYGFAGWRLGAIVDKKADELAQNSFMPDLQKSAGTGPDLTWNPRSHAVWRWSLAIGQRRRAFDDARRPLQQAAEQREEARRRAAREAQRETQRRQQEARQRRREAYAQQQAAQAKAVDDGVVSFDARAREFRQSWRPSSRQERQLGLTELRHQLQTGRDAVRDKRGEILAPSIPGVSKEQAQQIAGVIAFVLQCDDAATAAAGVRERLARETELAEEHEQLRTAAAQLPVADATQQMLAEFHPELRRACKWLSAHWDGIAPVLRARGGEAAERLHAALDQPALSP